jgi:hypothetical protein
MFPFDSPDAGSEGSGLLNLAWALDAREPGDSSVASVYGLLPDGIRARVKDVTPWGAWLSVPSAPALTFHDIIPFLICNAKDRVLARCSARVLGLAESEHGCEIMLWVVGEAQRWREVAQRVAAAIPDARRPPIPSPSSRLHGARVTPRLRALALEHARALVRSLAHPDGPALPARLDPERGLLMEWHPGWASLEPPFEVQLEGSFSTVKFVESNLRWSGSPRPTEATVIRRRQLRRVGVPSGARMLLCGTAAGDEISLDLPMHDVSFGGVAGLLAPSLAPQLRPGTEISDVIVTWRGGPGLRFVGEVRHRSPDPNRGVELLGLRLYGGTEDQHERWAREVETLLYPQTRSYGHDYESIWNLFEESGYFDISDQARNSTDQQLMRSSFETAYKKIEAAPHLGCIATYESPTRVETSISGLRAWSRAWFGTQLARNPTRPHIANSDSGPLKDIIYHVYERAGANPELDWIVHYVRDDAPSFSQVLFRDLVLSVPGACGVPFEVWKIKVTMLGDGTAPNVYPATARQIQKVLARLRDLRPGPYLEALDLLPETFDQTDFKHEWAIHGLDRDRTMLVAADGRQMVAAAVLETMEDGLHVYGLLDGVRLFELVPGGRSQFAALLVAANEWFCSMAKSYFVCFDEDGVPEIMRSVGAQTMGTAVTTFLPRHATPELLERVSELTVPKLAVPTLGM